MYMCIVVNTLVQFFLNNFQSVFIVVLLYASLCITCVYLECILNSILTVLLSVVWYFQSVACKPIASIDHFLPENLGSADLVEEVQTGSSKIVKVSNYKVIKINHIIK
jgi:hypothetical protein